MQDIHNGLSQYCSDLDSDSFPVSEIKKAAKLLKTKKACGNDGVFNEHLANGGNGLFISAAVIALFRYVHTRLYPRYT